LESLARTQSAQVSFLKFIAITKGAKLMTPQLEQRQSKQWPMPLLRPFFATISAPCLEL
jgi:hypothetical protein